MSRFPKGVSGTMLWLLPLKPYSYVAIPSPEFVPKILAHFDVNEFELIAAFYTLAKQFAKLWMLAPVAGKLRHDEDASIVTDGEYNYSAGKRSPIRYDDRSEFVEIDGWISTPALNKSLLAYVKRLRTDANLREAVTTRLNNELI